MNGSRVIAIFAIAGGLYFAALNVDAPLLYLLASIMMAFLLVTWFSSFRSLRKVRVKRQLPPLPIHEKQPVIIQYILSNRSFRYRFAIQIRDQVQHFLSSSREVFFNGWCASLNNKKEQVLNLSYQFPQRGRYTFGPILLQSDYPFGIFRRRKKWKQVEDIKVYPETIYLTIIPAIQEYLEFLSMESRLFIGHGDEFYGIREYRHGDPLRHIHWKATARHRDLMVREVQRISEPKILIYMDSQKNSQAGIGLNSTYESIIKIAASISAYCNRNHYFVEFYTQNQQMMVTHDLIMDYLSDCLPESEVSLTKVLWNASLYQKAYTTLYILFAGHQPEILSPLSVMRQKQITLCIIHLQSHTFESPQIPDVSPEYSEYQKKLSSLTPYYFPIKKDDSISKILQSSVRVNYAFQRE